MVGLARVEEVHDLHVWEITSGQPALSAHVLVDRSADCHAVRRELEAMLARDYEITHTTLQVDHVGAGEHPATDPALQLPVANLAHCQDSHGQIHRKPQPAE